MKSRKLALLMLPLLVAFMFQATQYARAPVAYNYYVVYAENADIALRPGTDLSSNGNPLLQNSTQFGLYNLTLGRWGPGYDINYTDAFHVINREVFNITMVGFNFTGTSTGHANLRIYVLNDTDLDGAGDTEVEVWDGTNTVLNSTYYIWLKAAGVYGNDGGDSKVKLRVLIPETVAGLDAGTNELGYTGKSLLWFTSTSF
jgi:hypothetical protein